MSESQRLLGKVAIVTGAANGIGKAIAECFAQEACRVVLNDRDEAALKAAVSRIEASGGTAIGIVGDVSVSADVKRLVQGTVESFGRVDIMVANAGLIPGAKIAEADAELWDRTFAVNGRGMFLCCKYAAEQMLLQEPSGPQRGSIICTSSISAFGGLLGQSVYGPAKFVASGIAKHFAIELAPRGVRVNAIAPGTVDTPALAGLGQATIDDLIAKHPIGRMAQPIEIAKAYLFLASDDASFVTGAVIPVDGGFTAQ